MTENQVAKVQIGWLTDPLIDEDDVGMITDEPDFGPDVSSLKEYAGTETITHSHGPISKPIPVYIDWAPGMWDGSA